MARLSKLLGGGIPWHPLVEVFQCLLLCAQGLDTRNFSKADYDLESIFKHKTVDSLVASIKAEAAAPIKARQTSRSVWLYSCNVSVL